MREVVNLEEAFDSFDEQWSPRIVAQINDYDVKIAHVAGEFVWHQHADTDEFFLVTAGRLVIDLDGPDRCPSSSSPSSWRSRCPLWWCGSSGRGREAA